MIWVQNEPFFPFPIKVEALLPDLQSTLRKGLRSRGSARGPRKRDQEDSVQGAKSSGQTEEGRGQAGQASVAVPGQEAVGRAQERGWPFFRFELNLKTSINWRHEKLLT